MNFVMITGCDSTTNHIEGFSYQPVIHTITFKGLQLCETKSIKIPKNFLFVYISTRVYKSIL